VRPGIEVLATDSAGLLAGLRVGLITNQTGISRNGTAGARLLLEAGIRVVVLLAPEHGFQGKLTGGESVPEEFDPESGLPVLSLYGEERSPDPAILRELDALVFDIQDVGARYYTFISTMAESMMAAAGAGLPFVVADRPNPVGGTLVQGNVLDPAFSSFVGLYPIPMRHGLTVGELALLFNREFGIGADLHVIPAKGWRRSTWASETGLPWVPPSPNMPNLESAIHYPGTCLFEGTNLSVGRGTDGPFQQVGAPWLDSEEVVSRLSGRDLPGIRFEAVRFIPHRPDDGKYGGQELRGVRLVVTDRQAYDPTRTAVALLIEIRQVAGGAWEWRADAFDRLAGTAGLRRAVEAGASLDSITGSWSADRANFEIIRRRYLLYR